MLLLLFGRKKAGNEEDPEKKVFTRSENIGKMDSKWRGISCYTAVIGVVDSVSEKRNHE